MNLLLFFEVIKARLVSLVLWSVAVGFYMASQGPVNFSLLFKTLVGTALTGAGAMALNQFLERETDAKMTRTANRPLPMGRITPRAVLTLGVFLSLTGLISLAAGVNFLTAFLAALVLAAYLGVYTPLKKWTSFSTLIGALPGATPPVLGWTGAAGELGLGAGILFLIIFVWQIPHVFAISWVHREDYGRAGFKMLATKDSRGDKVGRQILIYSLALLPVSFLPFLAGMAGKVYALGALVLGVWFVFSGWKARRNVEGEAKPFFRMSIIYLSILFLILVLDKKIL